MKSRANFKGHPIHPMLIVFPIAFLVGAMVADLLGRIFDWPTVMATGAYLSIAGIISGLIAGVPGFIDWMTVVPPNSSAKKRGLYHMVVNVGALALVGIGAIFRDWDTLVPGWGTIVLEVIANGLMSVGGWLGGTLAYRNQVGVDHRHANASKYREATVTGKPGESVVVDKAADMTIGQMWLVHWKNTDPQTASKGEHRLVLARTEQGFAAFDDRCCHKGASLADGALICGTVQCPWHGSQFDVHTGQLKAGPSKEPIRAYPARLDNGQVRITLPVAG